MTPIHVYTDFSRGILKSKKIAKVVKDLGCKACCITDINSISGCVQFYESCTKAGIKPILGCVLGEEGKYITALAKNRQGWYDLIKMVGEYHESGKLELIVDNCIFLSGSEGTELLSVLYEKGYDDALELARKMKSLYPDFYIEIQCVGNADSEYPTIREIAAELGIPTVATGAAYYATAESVEDHRLMICSKMKTTLPKARDRLVGDNRIYKKFFDYNAYYILSYNDLDVLGNTYEEIENTDLLADKCESYSILADPIFPDLGIDDPNEELIKLCREGWKQKAKPDWDKKVYGDRVKEELDIFTGVGLSPYFLVVADYMNFAKNQGYLCGYARGSGAGSLVAYLLHITEVDPIKHDLLFDRFFNPARYVQDHINFEEYPYTQFLQDNSKYEPIIENTDDEKFNAELELFDKFRKGREYLHYVTTNVKLDKSNKANSYVAHKLCKLNKPKGQPKLDGARVSLPDIDSDFPIYEREIIIQYLRDKFGSDKVSQISAFGRMMGRGAIKEVLRIHEACDFETANLITKDIPDEAEIADELEEQGIESIIMWSLKNIPEAIKEFAYLEDGEIKGDYGHYFAQAVRLEGVYKTVSKHAAGIIITDRPLKDIAPMIRDPRSGEMIVALDKKDAEKVGLVKYDLLGVASLSKLMAAQNLLLYGKMFPKPEEMYV